MSDLPPEVIDEIFSCLPVKSLLRFRCVSKPFLALIDSTDFIKSHLNRALESNSRRNIIVRDGYLYYSVDLDSSDNPNLLNHPGKTPYVGTDVLGHSNGLLCLLVGKDVFLWNPWTRVHKKLPVAEIEFPDNRISDVIYGFGYDGVNDDYKVVRIIQFFPEVDKEVKVYSMKSDSWRRVKGFPYFFHKDGVLVSGALHWVVTRDDDRLIASFDIATEEYRLIPQPEYVRMGFHMSVGEVGGKLTIHCNYERFYMDVWVMNYYGVRESWITFFSVAQPIHNLRPMAYSNDGEKVLLKQDGGKLLWYDLKLKIVKGIRIDGVPTILDAFVCVQSLVKLPGGTKTQQKTQQKRKRIQQKKTQQKRLIWE